ncbi:MAG: Chromosome partition protein Smc [Phycisphaerae bacterium]|nr:Chromosome partition protein Smc [Phycisphaerae bacterium]
MGRHSRFCVAVLVVALSVCAASADEVAELQVIQQQLDALPGNVKAQFQTWCDTVEQRLSGVEGKLDTANTALAAIQSNTGSMAGGVAEIVTSTGSMAAELDGAAVKLTAIKDALYQYGVSIASYNWTMDSHINTMNTTLSSINNALTLLNTNTTTIKNNSGTANTHLSTIKTETQGVHVDTTAMKSTFNEALEQVTAIRSAQDEMNLKYDIVQQNGTDTNAKLDTANENLEGISSATQGVLGAIQDLTNAVGGAPGALSEKLQGVIDAVENVKNAVDLQNALSEQYHGDDQAAQAQEQATLEQVRQELGELKLSFEELKTELGEDMPGGEIPGYADEPGEEFEGPVLEDGTPNPTPPSSTLGPGMDEPPFPQPPQQSWSFDQADPGPPEWEWKLPLAWIGQSPIGSKLGITTHDYIIPITWGWYTPLRAFVHPILLIFTTLWAAHRVFDEFRAM